MKRIKEMYDWLDKNRETAYSLIRIYLGIALFTRGLLMMSDPSGITSMAGAHEIYWWHSLVFGAHIICGLLMIIGFQVRMAAAIQLPILIGAVFFIHLKEGLMTAGQSLELSVLVMFLLFIYLCFGSGPLSLDNKVKK